VLLISFFGSYEHKNKLTLSELKQVCKAFRTASLSGVYSFTNVTDTCVSATVNCFSHSRLTSARSTAGLTHRGDVTPKHWI